MFLQAERLPFFSVIVINISKSLAILVTFPLSQSHFDEIGASHFTSRALAVLNTPANLRVDLLSIR